MEGVLSPLIVAFGDVRVVSVLNGEKKLRDKLSRATRQAVNAQAALSQARAALVPFRQEPYFDKGRQEGQQDPR